MTPYQRIMEAAKKGKGLRLSKEEVQQMSRDDAISSLAMNDDEDDASRCVVCMGTGKSMYRDHTCYRCSGTGRSDNDFDTLIKR